MINFENRLRNLEKQIKPGIPPDQVIILHKDDPDFEEKLKRAQELEKLNPEIAIIIDNVPGVIE